MYRRWHARKLLRTKCYERYEKKFSEKYCAFYYLSGRDGTQTWEKPRSLGSYDMQVVNEWRGMRDNQGYPYYYNPSTMRQTWKHPKSTVFCEETVVQDWEPIHPQKTGPCPNFASKRCNDDMRFYCDPCWERKYSVSERHKLLWKQVDGAAPNSEKIQYNDMEDKIDHFPEDDARAAEEEWEAKQAADFATSTFDPNKRKATLLGVQDEGKSGGGNNYDKIMAKSAARQLTAEEVAAKAGSLTVGEMKKTMQTNRQLVSKYSDWMKGGARGGALAGSIEKWGKAGGEKNPNDKYGHFLADDGEELPPADLMKVAFKEWQKFRRTAIYEKKFDLANPDSKHALSAYQGDAVADLLTQFGVKVKVQVNFDEVDADGDGELDRGELKVMLVKEFGEENVTDAEIEEIFSKFDKDGGGTLDKDEYEVFKGVYEKEVKKKKTNMLEGGTLEGGTGGEAAIKEAGEEEKEEEEEEE